MSSERPRILAIDDTPGNLRLLASAMARDYAFQLATSGAQGLAMAERMPPDLILLDVMMPEMDGFETCRRFKADPRLAGIPLVFITAVSDSRSEVSGLELGAVDYLHKPIGVDIARQRIRNLLERATLARELAEHRELLEQQVAERTAELQAANRELIAARAAADCAIRAKMAFLANMSHELHTPLNAIMGFNDLIVRQADEAQRARMHARLSEATQQMMRIVKGILQLAELEGDKSSLLLERFNVREVVDMAIAHNHGAAVAKGLVIKREMAANLPRTVHGMASALRQILENLIANAVKFSTAGDITVRASIDVADDDCVRLVFEVEDHGIGIADADVKKLFSDFSQVDDSASRPFDGLGIGLAIARHLTSLLGGAIGCRSCPGVGSCFWLTVPFHHYSYEGLAHSLAGVLPAASPEPAASAPGKENALAARQLAELDRLIELTSFDDLMARQHWQKTGGLLAPLFGDDLSVLIEALDNYAFDDARRLLEQTRSRLADESKAAGAPFHQGENS